MIFSVHIKRWESEKWREWLPHSTLLSIGFYNLEYNAESGWQNCKNAFCISFLPSMHVSLQLQRTTQILIFVCVDQQQNSCDLKAETHLKIYIFPLSLRQSDTTFGQYLLSCFPDPNGKSWFPNLTELNLAARLGFSWSLIDTSTILLKIFMVS